MSLGAEDTTFNKELKKKQLKIVPTFMELPFQIPLCSQVK